METISCNARMLLDEVDGSSIAVVGSTAPGPVDFEQGRVKNAPHLTQFIDVPFRDLLEEELAVPAVVDNDGNAAVLAEHRFGCGQDVSKHALHHRKHGDRWRDTGRWEGLTAERSARPAKWDT